MSRQRLEHWIGPRISREEMARGRAQFLLPTLFLGAAGLLLMVSIFLPSWEVRIQTPQYSSPLELAVYVNHLEGDVHEIEGLRHLLPADPLPARGRLELSFAVALVVVMALLVVGAVYIHNRWAALLSLPGALFPVALYADLRVWLVELEAAAGPSLTVSHGPGTGAVVAATASLLILVGLVFHRRAYRPLVLGGE